MLFWGPTRQSEASDRLVQFLSAFFPPLFRYEDEIRLCSGMEYTFMELKKVSDKRSFASVWSVHQPCSHRTA